METPRRLRVTMPIRFATVLAAAVLALVACGGEEQAPEAQPPSDGGQPPAEQVLPTEEQLTGEELVRESAAVAETVARAARRLTEDPQADVADELARAQERARSLGAQAEWSRERPQRAEPVDQELGAKARLGLLRLNARTEAAARRLGGTLDVRPVNEQQVPQVARQELERLRDELSALRDAFLPGLRERLDELSV
ncbi:MAG TPA: hypothetical protein VGV40_03520 [Solirubrobacteraceae bacterium]|nr:hypothetical protein [Solirubrobacteraceae bacterium]